MNAREKFFQALAEYRASKEFHALTFRAKDQLNEVFYLLNTAATLDPPSPEEIQLYKLEPFKATRQYFLRTGGNPQSNLTAAWALRLRETLGY